MPVTDATSAYIFKLRFSGPQVNCRGMVFGPLLRDVRAGERLHMHQPTNGCRGIFRGSVSYGYDLDASFPPIFGGKAHRITVGTFTVDAR